MTDLEVRGFLTTGCNKCRFAEADVGDYDAIRGYYCKLSNHKIETNASMDLPEAFPRNCRLKIYSDANTKTHQKYKRIVDLLTTANVIIKER